MTDDAEYLIIAYGSMSRIAEAVIDMARSEGYKLGLLRPITLFPFPNAALDCDRVKSILTIELNAGQMVEDVRLVVNGRIPVNFYGRYGGMVPSPDEILTEFKKSIK